AAALTGALLPFGGAKGANIAMMIELLAAMSGGSFSLDAAPFDTGSRSPRLGLFIAAIDPTAFDPGYEERAETHLLPLHDRPARTSRSPRACTRHWPPPPTTSESRQHEKHADHPYRRRPRRGAARAGGHRGSAHRPRRDHGRAPPLVPRQC